MKRIPIVAHRRRLLGALVLTCLVACDRDSTGQDPRQPRPAVRVALAEATPLSVPAGAWATGRTVSRRRVAPGTKILGRVERVMAEEGQRVARGDPIARLESRDLAAGLDQAEAGVKVAEAYLEQARVQETRIRALAARGSATAKSLENAVADLRVAEARLTQARADTETARVLLSYAEITSPITGWVIVRNIEAGDMARPGMPLFEIEDLSRLEVHLDVPEREAIDLAEGDAAEVEILRVPESASVHRVVPAGDPASRTFRVELLIDNADGRLKSGMFARARFPGLTRSALAVPVHAVIRRGQLDVLLIAADDGRLRQRLITLGAPVSGPGGAVDADLADPWVEVLSGLEAGERYVTDPAGLEAAGAPYVTADASP